MTTFLITLLFCIVIPPIFNILYAFIVVKFNLWNELSEVILCDSNPNHKITKDNILWLIVPCVSLMSFMTIFSVNFIVVIYKVFKVLLYPLIKLYEFMSDGLTNYFNKVEDKREFFEKLNNH